jgi:hypothetical protein
VIQIHLISGLDVEAFAIVILVADVMDLLQGAVLSQLVKTTG